MDRDRVIYAGSFNKILFPALRIAYALVPEALIDAFVDAKHVADGHTALLSQGVLAAFISEGHLAHHLRTTRLAYNERRLAFLEEAHVLRGFIEFGPAVAGMHVTGVFKDPALDDRAIAKASAALGVEVAPLSRFGNCGRRGLVFGFACAPRDAARQGLRIVRRVVADHSRAGGVG
jgi:GntR family transcriptional regulator/MocR family aminotransferase